MEFVYELQTNIVFDIYSKENTYKTFCSRTKLESYLKEKGYIVGILPTLKVSEQTTYLYFNLHSLYEISQSKLKKIKRFIKNEEYIGYCLLFNFTKSIIYRGACLDKAWLNSIIRYIDTGKYRNVVYKNKVYINMTEERYFSQEYSKIMLKVLNGFYDMYVNGVVYIDDENIIKSWNMKLYSGSNNLYMIADPVLDKMNLIRNILEGNMIEIPYFIHNMYYDDIMYYVSEQAIDGYYDYYYGNLYVYIDSIQEYNIVIDIVLIIINSKKNYKLLTENDSKIF